MSSQSLSDQRNVVRQVLRACRTTAFALVVISVTINLLMLTGPLYMLQVYDRVLASGSVPTLVALSLLAVLAYSCLAILDSARTGLMARMASRFEGQLQDLLISPLLDKSLRSGAHEAFLRVKDVRQVRQFLSSPVPGAILDLPWVPVFLLIIFLMHPVLGLVSIVGGVILIAIAVFNELFSRRRAQQAQRQSQATDRIGQDMFDSVEVFTALGMRPRMREQWQSSADFLDKAALLSGDRLSGFSAATKAFRLLLQSAILGVGAYLALRGDLSAGSMVAASIIMGRALAPVEQLVGQWRSVIAARTSWKQIRGELEDLSIASPPMSLPAPTGFIAVENAFVAPPGVTRPVLRNLTFSVKPGELLAVIGPSASGKTSLGKALVGLWPTMNGFVRYDGADLKSWNLDDLGPHIGYLPQEVGLSDGTVALNISRMTEDADPAAVIEAAKSAGCHDMILSLSDGYDTRVGTRGQYLSAGQRQRIGLARAMFGAPAVLVLDEPNANLDSQGDAALAECLNRARVSGSAVIVIAHRPSIVTLADNVLVLEAGHAHAFGPREDVLGKKVAPLRAAGS